METYWLIEQKNNIPNYQWLITPEIFTSNAYEAQFFKTEELANQFMNQYCTDVDSLFISDHGFY